MHDKAEIDYVRRLQDEFAKSKSGEIGVFVVPFNLSKNEEPEVIRHTATPGLFMVQVMSTGGLVYISAQRIWTLEVRHAYIFGPKEWLNAKYEAGQNIGGRIVTEYSCDDKSKDRKWSRLIAHITDIACLDSNGRPIYYFQYWTDNEDALDNEHPVLSNLEEIRAARAAGARNP